MTTPAKLTQPTQRTFGRLAASARLGVSDVRFLPGRLAECFHILDLG